MSRTRILRQFIAPFYLSLSLFLAAPVQAQQIGATDSAKAAFAAAQADDWTTAFSLGRGEDALTRALLQWTWLRESDSDASFVDYLAFVPAHADWPGMDRLRARGEEIMPPGLPPELVINWFGGHAPETGQGAVRLAQGMIARGDTAGAEAMLRTTWLGLSLTDEGHAALIAAYPAKLAPYHAARADAMLWRRKLDDAARMIGLLSGDAQALYSTRLALAAGQTDADLRFRAIPARLQGDAGLAYDRFNWLAARGDTDAAVTLLRERSTSVEALQQPLRWSGWRRVLARSEMREGRYAVAYELTRRHFLTPADGESYADLEWLAGFIALRFLDQPNQALVHFTALARGVDTSISLGRAGYWIGRTQEVLGNAAAAAEAYADASQHQTSFYGLLAAEKLALPLATDLAGREVFADWRTAGFLQSDTGRAALILLDAGERTGAVQFFSDLGRTLGREEMGQLGALLQARNEPFFAILIGKAGAARGMPIAANLYPLHPLATKDIPVSPELALSIARRESEFREDAGSAAGALGLMQVMPATAQDIARDLDLPYSRAQLIHDWDYNATLGTRYLADLEARFGPSPVFVAAGYNAGPRRPAQWLLDQGDPRLGQADIIDWIELIPLRETRDYVQRVAEAIPIYRARLTGETGAVNFTEMLIGRKPVVRPVARPVPDIPAQPEADTAAPGLAPLSSLRPVARPAR